MQIQFGPVTSRPSEVYTYGTQTVPLLVQSYGRHYKTEAGNRAPDGAIYVYSFWILKKGLHLDSLVQLASVKDAPPFRGGGG